MILLGEYLKWSLLIPINYCVIDVNCHITLQELYIIYIYHFAGAVFTFGKSKFAENAPSKFWIKKDEVMTNHKYLEMSTKIDRVSLI